MSGKLDKPLDEIVSAQRQSAARRRSSRRSTGNSGVTAPVGGVQKTTKAARGVVKAAPAKAAAFSGESKVIVSNLVCLFFPRRCTSKASADRLAAQGCVGTADQGMFPLRHQPPDSVRLYIPRPTSVGPMVCLYGGLVNCAARPEARTSPGLVPGTGTLPGPNHTRGEPRAVSRTNASRGRLVSVMGKRR